jgi:hypothetical protein
MEGETVHYMLPWHDTKRMHMYFVISDIISIYDRKCNILHSLFPTYVLNSWSIETH